MLTRMFSAKPCVNRGTLHLLSAILLARSSRVSVGKERVPHQKIQKRHAHRAVKNKKGGETTNKQKKQRIEPPRRCAAAGPRRWPRRASLKGSGVFSPWRWGGRFGEEGEVGGGTASDFKQFSCCFCYLLLLVYPNRFLFHQSHPPNGRWGNDPSYSLGEPQKQSKVMTQSCLFDTARAGLALPTCSTCSMIGGHKRGIKG